MILQHVFINSSLLKMTGMTQIFYNILLCMDWGDEKSSGEEKNLGRAKIGKACFTFQRQKHAHTRNMTIEGLKLLSLCSADPLRAASIFDKFSVGHPHSPWRTWPVPHASSCQRTPKGTIFPTMRQTPSANNTPLYWSPTPSTSPLLPPPLRYPIVQC